MNFMDDAWDEYENRLKWLMIETVTLRKYENNGFERRLEKGRLKEKLAIAKKLLASGMDKNNVA